MEVVMMATQLGLEEALRRPLHQPLLVNLPRLAVLANHQDQARVGHQARHHQEEEEHQVAL